MEYTLKCGEVKATVRNLGGELISFVKDGKEYCWTGDEKYWFRRSPALFPFVGGLIDGKVLIEGEEYYMPDKHGFLRDSELELLEISDTKAIFELRSNEETLKKYPYKFSFKMIQEIYEDGFDTTYSITNIDDKPIMFCVGGHPGFLLENIEDYKLVFECDEDADLVQCDKDGYYTKDIVLGHLSGREIELKYSDFDLDSYFVDGVKSRKVSIVEKATGKHHLTFDFNGFSEFVVWTPPKKNSPFLCLEPWNGVPAMVGESGRFEDKPYCKTLGPGENYQVGYKVRT